MIHAQDDISKEQTVGFDFDGFDPTKGAAMQMEIKRPSIGKTPAGFPKLHAELLPSDLMKMLSYDPRTIQGPPKKGAKDPQNISPDIIELHRKVQRSIDQAKVDAMVEYLHHAVSGGGFADWAEIDVVTVAKADTSKYESQFVALFPNSADFFITDGQHRYCAILDFCRRYPELAAKFTQAIAISVLPHDKLDEWAGQSFHDKNYLHSPVKATKALAADSRDLHNRLAKELRHHKVIRAGGGVNDVKDSLAAGAKEFVTHAVLYKLVRGFCEGRVGLDKGNLEHPNLSDETYEKTKHDVFDFLDQLNSVFPNWTVVPGREEYLFRSSAALQALGVLGYLLREKVADAAKRQEMLASLGEHHLDWRRSNVADWGNVIGAPKEDGTVSPASSRQAIDGTIKFLKDRCGLTAHLSGTTSNAN
jgi:DGQHR domain-containing protein